MTFLDGVEVAFPDEGTEVESLSRAATAHVIMIIALRTVPESFESFPSLAKKISV